MAQQPTYLLAPNFTFKPRTGPIRLGNLIADPLRPHRVLTTIDTDVLSARSPRIEEAIEYERSVMRGTGHEVAVSVWAQFLQTVGARLSGERATRVAAEYTMDSLVTEYFASDPQQTEIEARIAAPRVRAVMKASGFSFRQPVYMVTGLKIARGFAAIKAAESRTAGAVEGGVPLLTPTGDVTVGGSVRNSVYTQDRDEWKAAGDIVFAYQLLKIELKGWKKAKHVAINEFRSKAAFLGLEDDDSSDESEEDDGDNEVEMRAATISDLVVGDEDKFVKTVIIGNGDRQVTVISFPDRY